MPQVLNSIYQFNDINDQLEIIVVDNSPTNENVRDYVYSCSFNNIKYIKADNKGFGNGNNIGARIANGEILAFINPDIIFITRRNMS